MIYIKLAFILPDQFTVAGGLLTRSLQKIVINLNNLNLNLNNICGNGPKISMLII